MTFGGLTLGLADTLLPYGIVVNAIAPGPTATPMLGKTEDSSISEPNNPSKRYAMPEEIASMAVYMVSDAGRMIVGGHRVYDWWKWNHNTASLIGCMERSCILYQLFETEKSR